MLFVVPDDYFKFHRKLMQVFFIERLDGANKFYWPHFALFILHIVYWILFIISDLMYIKQCDDNFEIFFTIGITALHYACFVITIFVITCKKGFERIIAGVQRNNFTFKTVNEEVINAGIIQVSDEFGYQDLEAAWKNCVGLHNMEILNDEMDCVVRENDFKSRKVCIILTMSYMALAVFDILNSYVAAFFYNFVISKDPLHFTLPYFNWFPFEIDCIRNYFIAGLMQMYALEYVMLTFLSADLLFFTIIIHLIYQLKTVRTYIEYISRSGSIAGLKDERVQRIMIVKCIRESQNLIKLVENLDALMAPQNLHKLIFAAIALTAFIMTLLNDEIGMLLKVSPVVALVGICSEPFITCLLPHMLTEHFLSLSDAMFELDWPSYSPSLRRDMVFMIARLQKPVYITAWKFCNISTSLFTGFISKTYSIFTLMNETK